MTIVLLYLTAVTQIGSISAHTVHTVFGCQIESWSGWSGYCIDSKPRRLQQKTGNRNFLQPNSRLFSPKKWLIAAPVFSLLAAPATLNWGPTGIRSVRKRLWIQASVCEPFRWWIFYFPHPRPSTGKCTVTFSQVFRGETQMHLCSLAQKHVL